MSDFNPDQFLAETAHGEQFDPDKFLVETSHPSMLESGVRGLAQGVTFGHADEITGALESALTDKTYKQARDESRANYKRAKEENPKTFLASEVAGGVAPLLIPGANLGVAGARGAIGLGAAAGGLSAEGNSEADNLADLSKDTLTGMGVGALTAGAGMAGAKALQKGSNLVSEKLAPYIAEALPVGEKENAAAIREAAERLGVKPTPGMISNSETVQKLENSLHQSPTIGGYLTRRSTAPVGKGMQDTTKELLKDAATVSPFESGEQAKKILADEVARKFKASTDTFNDLAQYTKDISSTPSSIKAVSRNIMSIPEVDTLELPFARQVVQRLEKEPTVDGIKMLRTMVGKKAASAVDGAERSAYWQIYAKLGRLEENTLKRGVINAARTEGEGNTIAQGMLGQLKGAKKAYANEMGNLENFAESARLGKINGPGGFTDKIDGIPSERLQEKLLPLGDVRQAGELQKNFPQAFSALKQARLRDLSEGVAHDDGQNVARFLRNTKDLNPEAQTMLFGDQAGKLNDLRTVNQALPEKVGPSGTSQAFDIKEMFNPVVQARDLARFGAYKYSSNEKLAKVASFLRSQPKFANMAENNPKAFQAAVYQFANRIKPEGSMPKAAQFNPQSPVDEREAKQSFLDGN
jgi:hypothetical protein